VDEDENYVWELGKAAEKKSGENRTIQPLDSIPSTQKMKMQMPRCQKAPWSTH
jgi:hypothetical protein